MQSGSIFNSEQVTSMSRDNLKPVFRRVPRFLLIAFMVLFVIPIHLVSGIWRGVLEGAESWKSELVECLRIDRNKRG